MRSLSLVSIAFLTLLLSLTANARTRAPKGNNERSLLYWRYLCENQPQQEKTESLPGGAISVELHCSQQGWTVRTRGDPVVEVVEHVD